MDKRRIFIDGLFIPISNVYTVEVNNRTIVVATDYAESFQGTVKNNFRCQSVYYNGISGKIEIVDTVTNDKEKNDIKHLIDINGRK